jgi:hypothetical protein
MFHQPIRFALLPGRRAKHPQSTARQERENRLAIGPSLVWPCAARGHRSQGLSRKSAPKQCGKLERSEAVSKDF